MEFVHKLTTPTRFFNGGLFVTGNSNSVKKQVKIIKYNIYWYLSNICKMKADCCCWKACALSAIWHEFTCFVRRGSTGISPQPAAVYADAPGHPAEPKLTANDSSADPSEQSTTTSGQSIHHIHWCQHNWASVVWPSWLILLAISRVFLPSL